MSFWSGEKLAIELPALINPFNPKNIDCASYNLRVGGEAFATSDKFGKSAPGDPIITILGESPNHTLRIRPGQFAFLLTHEFVTVPDDAIALISMRAKYKFQGLINVSGFHVDPGWSGKLLFSVYNAGANEVIISNEEELFLIVFSSLDRKSTSVYNGKSKGQKAIKPELINNMMGQVFSPLMLQRQFEDLKKQHDQLTITAATFKSNTQIAGWLISIFVASIGIFLASIALLPNFSGVYLAKMLESAGYEVKQTIKDVSTSKDAPPKKNK